MTTIRTRPPRDSVFRSTVSSGSPPLTIHSLTAVLGEVREAHMPMLTSRRSIQQLHSCPFRGPLQMSGSLTTLPLPTAYSSNAINRDLRYLPTPKRFTPLSSLPVISRLPDPRGASTTTCPALHSPKPNRGLEPPAQLPTTKPKTTPTRSPTRIPIPTCTTD